MLYYPRCGSDGINPIAFQSIPIPIFRHIRFKASSLHRAIFLVSSSPLLIADVTASVSWKWSQGSKRKDAGVSTFNRWGTCRWEGLVSMTCSCVLLCSCVVLLLCCLAAVLLCWAFAKFPDSFWNNRVVEAFCFFKHFQGKRLKPSSLLKLLCWMERRFFSSARDSLIIVIN